MFRSQHRVESSRRVTVLACLIILFMASMSWASGAAAVSAPAAAVGGGYVATPATVRSAQMTIDVPKLRCAAGKSVSITVGMFGLTRTGSSVSRWQLSVVASCHGVKASYRGVQADSFGHSTVLQVHPGDRVLLIKSSGSDYEIDDLSSGAAGGGSSASSPGGRTPTLAQPVLFGVQVDGHVTHVTIPVLQARISTKALTAIAHHAQRYTNKSRVTGQPGRLGKDGAFTVTASK